ncbi:hypothetical protein TSOC_007732 [Tetrabaena socialis]|uniref:Uncharacterized protein n=1 Tax=Tetrabaena socialis TaxID=47790 RepID=A0A2J8A0E0_9CHLO|nr:hypothetical protein TSOC_007732 [Tetrabaena socialis]|eukprot:PNH05984.1 hypothetical protein TSOC_007732 [Tetrabaena socialis]
MPLPLAPPLSPLLLLLLLLSAGLLAAPAWAASSYADYGDSDEFWQDAPPKKAAKEKIDPQTGARLVATTFRFFQARLRPDRTRTTSGALAVATALNEAFVDEGLSHNKALPTHNHVLSVQSREEWHELADAVFSHPDVYDVLVKEDLHVRPGAVVPYGELWRAEMGEGVPEPLAEQLQMGGGVSGGGGGASVGGAGGGGGGGGGKPQPASRKPRRGRRKGRKGKKTGVEL